MSDVFSAWLVETRLLWGMRVLPAVAGIFVVGRVGGEVKVEDRIPVKNYESPNTMRVQFALTYCSYVHFI